MRTTITVLALIAIASVFAFRAQSDEPSKADTTPTFATSQIGQELLDTLELAFAQRLTEYEAGKSGPEHAIRLNARLYDAQISAASASSRHLVAKNYLARAKRVERLVKRNLENGTGLSQELLEAKACRLSATLEVAKF